MLSLLGYLDNKHPTLEEDVDRIIELELELGWILKNTTFSTDQPWEEVSLSQLATAVPSVEWLDYFRAVMEGNKDFLVHKGTRVMVPSWDLIVRMGKWVKRVEDGGKERGNLMRWRMVYEYMTSFMDTGPKYLFSNNQTASSNAEQCVNLLTFLLPELENDLIIAKYLDDDMKTSVQTLFTEVKTAFGKLITDNAWMGNETKDKALEKLKATKVKIGDRFLTKEDLVYLNQSIGLVYTKNIKNIGHFNRQKLVKSLTQVTYHCSVNQACPINERMANAFHFWRQNQVHILIGLTRYYQSQGLTDSKSFLYGSLASLLGHELIHGFDDTGRYYDKDGLALDWWQLQDERAFNMKKYCLVSNDESFMITEIVNLFTLTLTMHNFPRWTSMTTSRFRVAPTASPVQCPTPIRLLDP